MIIGVSGRIGHGKDEVAKIIKYLTFVDRTKTFVDRTKTEISYNAFKDTTLEMLSGWSTKKMAGKLKKIASILLNVPESKFEDREFKNSKLGDEWDNMTVREFLQKLGTEAIRDGLHKHAWANAFWMDYNENTCNWVITDIRFPNEFESVKKRGGIMIHVHRPIPIPENEHESETALMGAEFDYYILNDFGIDGLLETMRDILKNEKIIG